MQHVTGDLVADQQWHQRDLAAGQLIGGRLRPEGVAEEQDHRPDQGRREDRQGDPPPVLARAGAHVLGRLTPLRPEAVDGRRDDQDHERELEVQIDDLESDLAVDREVGGIQVDAEALEPERQDPELPEREDEGQGQRHAGEVRGHAGERHERIAQDLRQTAEDDGVGEQEAEDAAHDRGDEADLDARREGVRDRR